MTMMLNACATNEDGSVTKNLKSPTLQLASNEKKRSGGDVQVLERIKVDVGSALVKRTKRRAWQKRPGV